MFRLPRDRRPCARARHHLNRIVRARALVEELEPRTLLAAAPLASVLMPSPSPLSRLGPGPMQPATVPPQVAGTPNGSQGTLLGSVAGSSPALAQPIASTTTGSGAPSGVMPNTALTQPLATGTAAALTNPATAPGTFTSVPPGTNPAAPATSPAGVSAATEVTIERLIITVRRLSGNVPLPFAELLLAQAPPVAPAPTNSTPNAVVNAPSFFNPATHRLLFVVGGPEDRSPEDYLDKYEDGRVFPSPERPPLPAIDAPRREATASVQEARAVAPAWPWACERYFAGEFAADEGGAARLPALGTAEGTRPDAVRLEANQNPAAAPELLAAVAGFGLLNGTRWQKEGPRDGDEPHGRRRPVVLSTGTV
jgi:hypothetical protein